jgi:Protein of unknown function (DUF3224)
MSRAASAAPCWPATCTDFWWDKTVKQAGNLPQTRYTSAIVPSSGTGQLAGDTGDGGLTVGPDGTHRIWLDYQIRRPPHPRTELPPVP